VSRAQAKSSALAAAGEGGWLKPGALVILEEATDITPTFRFVDDFTVRVRPSGSGSEIDVRSKSRDGQGDLGTNARRIRKFLDLF
jgi:uncharacterized protein (DUF1499 family)